MNELFAVIDTETTWDNELMSVGVAISNFNNFKINGYMYFIITPNYKKGGMYFDVLELTDEIKTKYVSKRECVNMIESVLRSNKISNIFAYNAKFDLNHLNELDSFNWYDIMAIAAYKQHNRKLPSNLEYCKSGRLKSGYSVENIIRMISNRYDYVETHNALFDSFDELSIMKELELDFNSYQIAKIN